MSFSIALAASVPIEWGTGILLQDPIRPWGKADCTHNMNLPRGSGRQAGDLTLLYQPQRV